MSLTMTPEDICKEYRTAKNRVKQIGVLAELNACTKKEIVEVLQENGEKLPGNVGPRKAAEPAPGEEPVLTAADVNYKERSAAPEVCEDPPDLDAIRRAGIVRRLIVMAFGGSNAHELESALLFYEDLKREAGI